MATLRTDYQNDILDPSMSGKRQYVLTENANGTYSLTDATVYTQQGSNFAAADMNNTNAEINSILRIVVSDTAPSDTSVLWVKPETE